MKFDIAQLVTRVDAGTIGAPQAVIVEVRDALSTGHVDMPVT